MPLGIFISRESACLKNLSCKPALNYLDISCPSLSGYLLAVSIVSFGIFGLLPLCCSWVCVSDNFSHERCESNRVMRAVFCCLLCFLRLIAHRRQTRREHILAMLSAPTIRSKGQSGAGQAAEWLTLPLRCQAAHTNVTLLPEPLIKTEAVYFKCTPLIVHLYQSSAQFTSARCFLCCQSFRTLIAFNVC
jgi:hypothetical protein